MSNQNGNGIPVKGQKPDTALEEFAPIIVFDKVGCYSCKKSAQAVEPILCRTIAELTGRSKVEHKKLSPLCLVPRLIIDYKTALISTSLLADLSDESILIEP
jgi:hypothetical protein